MTQGKWRARPCDRDALQLANHLFKLKNWRQNNVCSILLHLSESDFKKGLSKATHQIRQVLLKSISLGLKLKFGDRGQNLLPEIESISDVDLLETILETIDTASTVEEMRLLYQPKTDD